MGFLEVLTLIFVALKLMGFIDWSWLSVMSPMIFAVAMYIIMFIVLVIMEYKSGTSPVKKFKRKR